MDFKLVNLNQVTDYDDWLKQLGPAMTDDQALRSDLVQQLLERESQGSTIIDPGLVMPHVINGQLSDHVVIVSHLARPIEMQDQVISTAIVLLMRTVDQAIDDLMDRLISDDYLQQIKAPTIRLTQIKQMFEQE